MRQRWLLAATTSAVVLGAAGGVSAQGASAPSPPQRLFQRLFATPPATSPAPRETPFLMPPLMVPPSLPANRSKCDAAAVPLDTTIIRRVSIAPPASRLLTIRDAIKPGCR